MISNNIKSIALMGLLSVVLIVPLSQGALAYTLDIDSDKRSHQLKENANHLTDMMQMIISLEDQKKSETSSEKITALDSQIQTHRNSMDKFMADTSFDASQFNANLQNEKLVNAKITLSQWNDNQIKQNGKPTIIGLGFDHEYEALVVTLDRQTQLSGLDNSIKEKVNSQLPTDVAVIFEYSDGVKLDSCSARNIDCSDLVGGIDITDSSNYWCTLGLAVTKGTINGFITAGHCHPGEGTTHKIYQPYSAYSDIGYSYLNKWVNGGTTYCDCMFIKQTSSDSRSSQVFVSSTSYWTITGKSPSSSFIGQNGWLSGAASQVQSGSIISTNNDIWVTENSVTTHIYGLTKSTYTRSGGDSGGPIVSSTNKLIGTHTGGDSSYAYFTGWEISSNYLGIS